MRPRLALELYGEDGDVVFLAVGLGGGGDGFSGLRADVAGAVEAEKLAGGGLGFDYAVGEEGNAVVRVELEAGFVIGCIGCDAEGQAGFDLDFFAVAIGSKVSGVGSNQNAVRVDSEDEASGETAFTAPSMR